MVDTMTVSENIVLPTHYVRQIIKQVQTISGNGKQLSQEFDEGQLEEASVCFSASAFCRFILQAEQLTSASIGLLVGRSLLINNHGSLSYVIMNSGSIRQCVEMLENFLPLRTRLVSISSHTKDDCLCVQLTATQSLGEVERLVFEAIMVAIKNILNYLTMGQKLQLQAVFSFSKNKTVALAKRIFECELLYNRSWTGFIFSLKEVDRPLLVSDKDGFEKAIALCQQELGELDENVPLNKKVERLLQSSPQVPLTFEQVANTLGLSERTLYRRLEEENVRFSEITDKIKYQAALSHLKSGIKMQEVGLLLGYQYVSNFRRAFRRWKERYG